MSYAYVQEVPINWAIYERIRAELGWETPPGLVAHLVIEMPEGLRYIDVWQSKEDADRFFEDRVHPGGSRAGARRPVAGRDRRALQYAHPGQRGLGTAAAAGE